MKAAVDEKEREWKSIFSEPFYRYGQMLLRDLFAISSCDAI